MNQLKLKDKIKKYSNFTIKEKLKLLMDNEELLDEFSINCKEYAKSFYKENIVKSWINLFENQNK